jgi:hypothetical protein
MNKCNIPNDPITGLKALEPIISEGQKYFNIEVKYGGNFLQLSVTRHLTSAVEKNLKEGLSLGKLVT